MKTIRFKQRFLNNLASICVVAMFVVRSVAGTADTGTTAQPETSYDVLAKLYLPSQAQQAKQEKQTSEELEQYNKEALKKKAASFMVKLSGQPPTANLDEIKMPILGEVERLNIIYKIFSTNEQPSTINEQLYQDLEFFCNYEPQQGHTLFSLFSPSTTMGKVELQKFLAQPTTDVATLCQRQAFIKQLINNPTLLAQSEQESLLAQFEQQLAKLKEVETEFLLFWKNFDDAASTLFDKHYFSMFPSLNQNKYALQLSALWETLGTPVLPLLLPLAMLYPQYYIRHKFFPDEFRSFGTFLRNIGHGIWNLCKMYPQYAIPGTTAFAALQALSMYPPISSAIEYNKTSNLIQQKMINVASFSNVMSELDTLLSQAGQHDTTWTGLFEHGQATPPEDFKNFRDLLTTNTFKGEASFFSCKGKALAAFKTMLELKQHFVPLLKKVGQIDALVAVAKFFKAAKAHPHARFCFADYETGATKPHLALTNFWHPMLDQATVVTNNFELGGQMPAHDITITGPNSGGKSMILKSLAIAIVFALTIGIVPASCMILTPFVLINTYLNIRDRVGQLSGYQAELQRADNLVDSIQALGQQQFSFIIMDEMLKGTDSDAGASGAYGIAKKLAKLENSMCIIATHQKLLTELEKTTAGSFKNYKVFVIKNPDGSFTKPYKLVEGVSDQNIALDLLQQQKGFSADIVKEAQDAFARITQERTAPAAA